MAIGTLQAIITKVRKLTGTATSFQLTDAMIIDYINSFYLYDFPAQFRSLKLKDRYTFNTIRGIDVYPFDFEHYSTVQMPCMCAKREIPLYQDNWGFYGLWFNWQFQETLTQGDGSVGPYTGTTTANPIIRSVNNNPMTQTQTSPATIFPVGYPSTFSEPNPSRVQNILITANTSLGTTQNITDDGNGNLIGAGIGTIDYDTGAVSVTFTSVVPAGENITIMYNPTKLNIPQSILFFQNQFTLRPVPDKGYTIELVAYRLPSQAILGTTDPNNPDLAGKPEMIEWWETLAFGASKKIYQDRLDPDGVGLMEQNLQEAYLLNESRTYAQLGKQSMQTIYRGQLTNGSSDGAGWGWGTGSSSQ